MSEQLPGLELFLSSEKAVEGANKFRAAVESAAQAVERIGAVVDKLDDALDRMGVVAKSASDTVRKIGEVSGRAGDGLRQAGGGAQEFESKIGRLGVTAGSVGRQLTLLLGAAGAVSGLGAAVAVFSDYEDKLKILGSIANATGSDLKKLEQAASDLSRNSRFTPREALQGLTELSRAGLSAEDAIKALKPTADLARVGLLGLGDSSAIVTKTLTQFALGAEQSARVADVLAKAANASNADVGTLADALAKTGPVARQFGVSLEDTVAALAKLADNGLAANIAGTGLQRVLIQLRSPTEEAQRALLGLGLTAEKINPEKVGLTGALRNLRDAGVSVQDSVSLVGTEFASLLTILTGSVGAIDQVGEALRDSTGEAAKQAAAGADTLAAAFADLRNASEEFAVSTKGGGIGGALKSITTTGAEALRVLAGDKKALEEASAAGKLFATGLQLATVAAVTFYSARGAARVASVLGDVTAKLQQVTKATVLYEAATGLAAARVGGAAKAFGALSAVLRANPLVTVASAIALVTSALVVFGNEADAVPDSLEKTKTRAKELEDQYRSLADAITDAGRAPGSRNQADRDEGLRRAFEEAKANLRVLERLGSDLVPIEQVSALSGLDADTARIKNLISQLPELEKAAKQTAEVVRTTAAATLPGAFGPAFAEKKAADAYAVALREIADAKSRLGIVEKEFTDEDGKKYVRYFLAQEDALQKNLNVLRAIEEQAKATGVSLEKIGSSSSLDVSSAVQGLIRERERELELSKKTGAEREKAILIAEAEKRAGQGLNVIERGMLAIKALQIVQSAKLVEQRRRETQEAEKAAQLQRDLPKNLAELQKRYENELKIAQETGLQRELIRAAVEAENDAKEIGLKLTSDEFKALKEKAEATARLAFAEKQGKKEARVDRRQDEALRNLEQEEQLLKLGGAEREKYRLQIEAENEARQAGLVLGSAEFADYVKRKSAVGELARAQEQLAQLGSQFASSWTSALEQFIIDGGRARDVAKALYQDLARLAFRQTAGAGLNSLFQSGATALAGLFAGGAPAPSAPSVPYTGGSPFSGGSYAPPPVTVGSPFSGAGYQPRMLGGLIPAMVGAVIDQPTILQRGDSAYSVAEGAKTTPEGIFRLARDERGNLGISAVGAGGDTFNMSFPAVRSAQDARALRATVSQQFRAAKAADRSGRRGRRPAGA